MMAGFLFWRPMTIIEELAILDARIPKFRDAKGVEIPLEPGGQEFIVTLGPPVVVRLVR
jgi:hypothetical protein